MNLKDSDVNHLRRLLGFIRWEVGQSPDDMVATVQSILPAIGEPSEEGKTRLVRSYLKSAAIPDYVRAAIKALEKTLAENPTVRAESKSQQKRFETMGIPHLPYSPVDGTPKQ